MNNEKIQIDNNLNLNENCQNGSLFKKKKTNVNKVNKKVNKVNKKVNKVNKKVNKIVN